MKKKFDVIVIGGGPAGMITAGTALANHPGKSVMVVKEEEKGMVPCGIPYVFGQLGGPDDNKMSAAGFTQAGGTLVIDKVENVNSGEKTISLSNGDSYGYGKLVFATGSRPWVPSSLAGTELEGVFTVRKSYGYIASLFDYIADKENIVVIGGGFIGAEIAEQLSLHKNKKVSLIEGEENCFMKAFSPELSKIATDKLRECGVDVRTSTFAKAVKGDKHVEGIELQDGTVIKAGAVILATGYTPNTELALDAGLPLNDVGAILVDNYGRTNVKDVCAVGDCSQTIGFLTGRRDNIMLASTATAEAKVLGHNIFGIRLKRCFAGTLGVFSTEINGLSMASAGLNGTNAHGVGVDYITASAADVDRHPGTLPDTQPMNIKLYVSPTDGSVLGGEIWGGKSAGEMINTISLAIQKMATVFELVSYQFGSHPLLTGAPTKNIIKMAAEKAIKQLNVK